ncbi:hypothetical protein JZ751_021400 [Albula glossodonta]|uniref:Uncharacterized protein n=1 Tax=Albula glossodonta TaxID=121402 RepID=A0A8T2NSQ0_9TELE|nr:hypothetical protein JZ751_021400 [Albula glossodonta]
MSPMLYTCEVTSLSLESLSIYFLELFLSEACSWTMASVKGIRAILMTIISVQTLSHGKVWEQA